MAFVKVVVFAALVGLIAAQKLELEYSEPAKYNFHYAVDDPTTGDQKAQEETRDGDSVQGFYSLVEPDGTVRRVDYTADAINGFQATVSKDGHSVVAPAPVARAIVADPAIHLVHEPTVKLVSQPAVATRVLRPALAPRYYQPQIIANSPYYNAPLSTPLIQSAPIIRSSPFATPYLQSSPIVHSAPLVSTVPQYITKTLAAPRPLYL